MHVGPHSALIIDTCSPLSLSSHAHPPSPLALLSLSFFFLLRIHVMYSMLSLLIMTRERASNTCTEGVILRKLLAELLFFIQIIPDTRRVSETIKKRGQRVLKSKLAHCSFFQHTAICRVQILLDNVPPPYTQNILPVLYDTKTCQEFWLPFTYFLVFACYMCILCNFLMVNKNWLIVVTHYPPVATNFGP